MTISYNQAEGAQVAIDSPRREGPPQPGPTHALTVLPRRRGAQKAPVKEQVTLRLSREVLAHFRATGRGWQRRIDEALKDIVASPR